ncbi:MAG: efflux transporter outer membrane subunit [Myxococcota bacterium]
MNPRGLITAGVLVAAAPGCLLHAVDTDPQPPLELPDAFAAGRADAVDPGPWWTRFDDRELEALMDRALTDNFQLRQARARVAQASFLEKAAAAGLFPQVNATVGASRSQSPPRVFNLGGQEQEIPGVEADNFSASLPVSYELDVWGRVRAGMLAAEQDRIAAAAEVETLAITIAANVTERWFDLLEQRSLRRLVQTQVETNRTNLRLVELRFTEGDAALNDILQQRQQIQVLEAQLALVKGQERVAEQQLAALLGTTVRGITSPTRTELPEPPPLPDAGVPARLLERRPDVRAAKARVVASDYRVAQAIANRLPQLSLSGSIGFNSVTLGSFFESFIWSIAGNIAGTVWDGGRLDAEIARNKAVVDERVAAYGQALVTALTEVESALVQERAGRERIAILEGQVATAEQTLEAARRRFSAGIGNYLAVLTALRSLQGAEQTLLTTRRQLLSQRIQVYRALGSEWTRRLPAPDDDDDDAPVKKASPS